MSFRRSFPLNSGVQIPRVGFGTWKSSPGDVGNAVFEALKAGYRHLDFAKIYENQVEIRDGMKRAFKEIPNLKREDIFITSKLWNTQHSPDLVEAALDDCLEELGLDYLDLYLIHWPVVFPRGSTVGTDLFPLTGGNLPIGDVVIDDNIPLVDTWKAMIKLPKSKARSIGVSNLTMEYLQAIIDATSVIPAVNQIERHPLLKSDSLAAFCKEKGIHITAYSAFGNNAFNLPLILAHPIVEGVTKKVSARLGSTVTPAQVLISWSQVGGHSVIPKSVTPSRIRENFQEIDLNAEEISELNSFDTQRRYNVPYVANTPRWDINIFNDPAETVATHRPVIV